MTYSGLGPGLKCLKCFLYVFTCLFLITGGGLLTLGIYTRIHANDFGSVIGREGLWSPANILIAAGALICIVAMLGCRGVWSQNRRLMAVFFVMLFIIFGLEVSASTIIFSKKDKFKLIVSNALSKAVNETYGKTTSVGKTFTKTLDIVQSQLKCCGIQDSSDWKKTYWYRNSPDKTIMTPKSCCKDHNAADCGKVGSAVYKKGCSSAVTESIDKQLNVAGGIGIGIGSMHCFGLYGAFRLCRTFPA